MFLAEVCILCSCTINKKIGVLRGGFTNFMANFIAITSGREADEIKEIRDVDISNAR